MAVQVTIDTDTWWHLRAGEWMVENRSLMEKDLFSYTREGTPWKYPGLWVEVVMYLIYQWFGPGGLNVWTTSLITLTFYFVWKTISNRGFLGAFVLIIAAAASGIYWSARPYLLSFLFAAVFIWFFEGYQHLARNNLWVAPVLMVLWVNSHGAFLIGFLIWGCYFIDSLLRWFVKSRNKEEIDKVEYQSKHLLVVGVLMGIVLFVNPQGIDLLSLPFTTVSRGAEQLYIEEWQSPNFHDTRMQPFAALLILTYSAMALSKHRATIAEILLVSGFGLMGLFSARFISIFAVVAPVVLVRHAEEVLSYWSEKLDIEVNIQLDYPPTPIQSWINRLLVLLLAVIVVYKASMVISWDSNFNVFREALPVDAVEYIKNERPEGQMFNSYNFGGYLIWALPEYQVFIDGRADLHGDEIIFEWWNIVRGGDGWRESLNKWDVGFVLVEPGIPLLEKLKDDNWELIYTDEVAVIYQR
jgi:MFS family permease